MKNLKEKIKNEVKQCGVCEAKFEIWLNNSKISDEKREKMKEHLLTHCPVCSRADSK